MRATISAAKQRLTTMYSRPVILTSSPGFSVANGARASAAATSHISGLRGQPSRSSIASSSVLPVWGPAGMSEVNFIVVIVVVIRKA